MNIITVIDLVASFLPLWEDILIYVFALAFLACIPVLIRRLINV